MNVYLIETPLQLLNVFEAKHYFGFNNNILVILLSESFGADSFSFLIDKREWDKVIFMPFYTKYLEYDFGERRPKNLYESSIEYLQIFQQFVKRLRLDRLSRKIGYADTVILGNYLVEHKNYMRHFANKLEHNNLYLVDDGTESIRINADRASELESLECEENQDISWYKKIKRKIKRRYVDWDGRPAQQLTFFSCYDLRVTGRDLLVKNEYKKLREMSQSSRVSDEVIFLGQCLVDDNYLEKENYRRYLSKAKEYFDADKFIYVPHPRETRQTVKYLSDAVGLEVRRLTVPIEYEITFGGNKPRYLASFFSSALGNCLIIFGQSINVRAIYLQQEHLLDYQDYVGGVYSYYEAESKNNPAFELVKLKL